MTVLTSRAISYMQRNGGKLPEQDSLGHRTRYSDSSLYDEVCVLCGGTDAMENQIEERGTWGRCPSPVSDQELKNFQLEADH